MTIHRPAQILRRGPIDVAASRSLPHSNDHQRGPCHSLSDDRYCGQRSVEPKCPAPAAGLPIRPFPTAVRPEFWPQLLRLPAETEPHPGLARHRHRLLKMLSLNDPCCASSIKSRLETNARSTAPSSLRYRKDGPFRLSGICWSEQKGNPGRLFRPGQDSGGRPGQQRRETSSGIDGT